MADSRYRVVKDSMGELKVPADALYGAQTQRAVENFPPSGLQLQPEFIQAIAMIKKAAAEVNSELGLLSTETAQAVMDAADTIIAGEHQDQFPIDLFQTGSGTSSNMNLNEVLATIAAGSGQEVSPNDHVNLGQSSNDVIPTAIHLSAAIAIEQNLLPALNHLAKTIEEKGAELTSVCKTGRTHLMDAMPIRMDQELSAWSAQIRNGIERIEDSRQRLHKLAQGGTAVGTGINAHHEFAKKIADKLSEYAGLDFSPNESPFEALSCQDTAVEISGQLKVLAVSVMKISNDLRWMNSGPLVGLAEIELPPLQPGSSIMPGKINPVIPEAAAMIAAQVIGNDTSITLAGQSGSFQLNVMLPLVAYNLLQSIELLGLAARQLADKAIKGFSVNLDRINEALARNPVLVTALNSVIGYMRAAEIAKRAYKEGRLVIEVALEETDLSREELERLLNPMASTRGGIQK